MACSQQLTPAAETTSLIGVRITRNASDQRKARIRRGRREIFLLSRVTEQAQTDQVALSDLKRKCLGLRRQSRRLADLAAMEKSDQQNDSHAFEAKIA